MLCCVVLCAVRSQVQPNPVSPHPFRRNSLARFPWPTQPQCNRWPYPLRPFQRFFRPLLPAAALPTRPPLIPYGLWRSLLPAPHCSLMLPLPLALTLANHAPCAEPAAALIHRPRPTILAPVRYVCSMQYVTQRNMNAGRARWEAQPGGGAVRSGAGTRGGRPPARFTPTPSSSGCQCTPGS